jgi:hypothetical protein
MKSISKKITELEGKWVALDRRTQDVLEYADTLKELNKKTRGISQEFALFKVPDLGVVFVPYARL